MEKSTETHNSPSAVSRAKWVLLAFLLIAGFLLWSEHQAHIMGALPWLLLLACPLLHVFMHHGHGHAPDLNHKNQQDNKDE